MIARSANGCQRKHQRSQYRVGSSLCLCAHARTRNRTARVPSVKRSLRQRSHLGRSRTKALMQPSISVSAPSGQGSSEFRGGWFTLAVGADLRLSHFRQVCRPSNEPRGQPENYAKARTSVAVAGSRHRRQGGSIASRRQHSTTSRGNYKGFGSVWITGNWRIVFQFDGSDIVEVDLVD